MGRPWCVPVANVCSDLLHQARIELHLVDATAQMVQLSVPEPNANELPRPPEPQLDQVTLATVQALLDPASPPSDLVPASNPLHTGTAQYYERLAEQQELVPLDRAPVPGPDKPEPEPKLEHGREREGPEESETEQNEPEVVPRPPPDENNRSLCPKCNKLVHGKGWPNHQKGHNNLGHPDGQFLCPEADCRFRGLKLYDLKLHMLRLHSLAASTRRKAWNDARTGPPKPTEPQEDRIAYDSPAPSPAPADHPEDQPEVVAAVKPDHQKDHYSPAPVAHVEPEEQAMTNLAESMTETVLHESAAQASLDVPKEQMEAQGIATSMIPAAPTTAATTVPIQAGPNRPETPLTPVPDHRDDEVFVSSTEVAVHGQYVPGDWYPQNTTGGIPYLEAVVAAIQPAPNEVTASEHPTPEPPVTEHAATEPAATDLPAPVPLGTEASGTEPSTDEPAAAQPNATWPAAAQFISTRPDSVGFFMTQLATSQPAFVQDAIAQLLAVEPCPDQLSIALLALVRAVTYQRAPTREHLQVRGARPDAPVASPAPEPELRTATEISALPLVVGQIVDQSQSFTRQGRTIESEHPDQHLSAVLEHHASCPVAHTDTIRHSSIQHSGAATPTLAAPTELGIFEALPEMERDADDMAADPVGISTEIARSEAAPDRLGGVESADATGPTRPLLGRRVRGEEQVTQDKPENAAYLSRAHELDVILNPHAALSNGPVENQSTHCGAPDPDVDAVVDAPQRISPTADSQAPSQNVPESLDTHVEGPGGFASSQDDISALEAGEFERGTSPAEVEGELGSAAPVTTRQMEVVPPTSAQEEMDEDDECDVTIEMEVSLIASDDGVAVSGGAVYPTPRGASVCPLPEATPETPLGNKIANAPSFPDPLDGTQAVPTNPDTLFLDTAHQRNDDSSAANENVQHITSCLTAQSARASSFAEVSDKQDGDAELMTSRSTSQRLRTASNEASMSAMGRPSAPVDDSIAVASTSGRKREGPTLTHSEKKFRRQVPPSTASNPPTNTSRTPVDSVPNAEEQRLDEPAAAQAEPESDGEQKEESYCYCGGPYKGEVRHFFITFKHVPADTILTLHSFLQMVGCENDDCPR